MKAFGDAVTMLQQPTTDTSEIFSEIDESLINEALYLSGVQSIRRRKLPAEDVAWLVIGMSLFTDSSVENVATRLGISLGGSVSKSAVCQARDRLGADPMRRIFALLCDAWSSGNSTDMFSDFRLFAIDGAQLRVPDSDANFYEFGKNGSRNGITAYPKVRLVASLDVRTRLLADASFGPVKKQESEMSEEIFARLPDNSICLLDRGYQGNLRFWRIVDQGINRHFVCRVRAATRFIGTQPLPDGSVLGYIDTGSPSQRKDPNLPRRLPVRVVEYRVAGHEPVRIFTSLLDPFRFPGSAIANLYHQRWEVELAFKELKTDLLDRREALRSRKPEGVRQELWGALIMYNLIRRRMHSVAKAHGVSANRMSFHVSSILIYDFFLSHSNDPAIGRLPERIAKLSEEIWRLHLPPRRSHRSFPRVVKIKMSPYLRKRPKTRTEAP